MECHNTYPTWKGVAYIYNVWNKDIEWKAVKRSITDCVKHMACNRHDGAWWQPGDNQRFVAEGHDVFSDVDVPHIIEADLARQNEASRVSEEKKREAEEAKSVYVNFEVENGFASVGETYYVVGSSPVLGDWNLAHGVEMKCVEYPKWVAEGIRFYDVWDQTIQWKAVRANSRHDAQAHYQPGFDNQITITDRSLTSTCDLGPILLKEIDHLREQVSNMEKFGTPQRCVVCKHNPRESITTNTSGVE
ncbi:hypothetical protein SARC_03938 [Sphaeroforma arctica JP610]|uniref:CBM20 domain-containing protein n=1 Tax=Sphaeroforma arctica JP610 TaxID=667725 RepID=A0A0L0G4U7_9EUKA|nr:hypothetical protein SARC_03938 [Sphaeroforma arctica JP610]KNC83831.1 hypothetical protein SARC_03938 [Sphaeroforma arctica JP610]|eukprot:XP_014157733.1 hypothetical protein SARC_03938 [Sphaeroforma arctica JP610]